MKIEAQDRERLRALAGRWMELAHLPVMVERSRQWTALKDLQPERPMVLFETWTVNDFVPEADLRCASAEARGLEKSMLAVLYQAEELGDDFVVDPFWRVYWQIEDDGYGVDIRETHADDGHGGDTAYGFNHPLRKPADIDQLRPRSFRVNREATQNYSGELDALFGDILPIRQCGSGGYLPALTSDLFRLIGNDNLLSWLYDEPQALMTVVNYLRDDKLHYYRWLEQENLLSLNNDNQWAGSGSPGFTNALPTAGYTGQTRLRDLWAWVESQETSMVSPRMFERFFLPAMAEVAELFGLVYYGCCEPVHDRWEPIIRAIPHIRAVSISPWCDMNRMGELLGKEVVFSRKPKPWLISGAQPDWAGLEEDLDATLAATRNGCLEIIYRDVYDAQGDRARLKRWVDLVRSRIGQ